MSQSNYVNKQTEAGSSTVSGAGLHLYIKSALNDNTIYKKILNIFCFSHIRHESLKII